MPVTKGDQIHINPNDLNKIQDVKWSQSFKSRNEVYYVTRFHNNTRGEYWLLPSRGLSSSHLSFALTHYIDGEYENEGNLYIQKGMLDKFKNKNRGNDFTLP